MVKFLQGKSSQEASRRIEEAIHRLIPRVAEKVIFDANAGVASSAYHSGKKVATVVTRQTKTGWSLVVEIIFTGKEMFRVRWEDKDVYVSISEKAGLSDVVEALKVFGLRHW